MSFKEKILSKYYIAQYYLLLGGLDIIVFTGGIGENSIPVRREICEPIF